MKKIIFIFTITLLISFYSCKDNINSEIPEATPPDTKISIFPDSGVTIAAQPSRIRVHWWGDNPTGFVIGFLFTWDDKNWYFTDKNDSTFNLKITGLDTIYYFKVAAIGDKGNKKYDYEVFYNGKNIGSEPYTDLNNNNKYDEGEPFVDFGKIDPTPAVFKFPIYNSPPEIKFVPNTTVPETTFTVASFYWEASDLEGNETIDKQYISLNDTSNFVEIPGNVRFVTIIARPPFTTQNIVNADILIGLTGSYIYSQKIPNLRLNSKNTFYLKAKDIAGSFSKLIQMPDTNRTWYVKKPTSEFLVVDDHITMDNTALFYQNLLDSLTIGGVALKNKYDVLDIKVGKTATTPAKFVPNFAKPTFLETMKLFKYIFWYSNDIAPTTNLLEQTVSDFTKSGGKIFCSVVIAPESEITTLRDFLPIDSISASPLKVIYPNSSLNPGNSGYPFLTTDNSSITWIRTLVPNALSSKTIYTLSGIGITGSPVVALKTNDSRLIFINMPLNRLTGGGNNVRELFRKVLRDEFGFQP